MVAWEKLYTSCYLLFEPKVFPTTWDSLFLGFNGKKLDSNDYKALGERT